MKIQKFEDIIAWQRSRELIEKVYRLTNRDKFNRDFSLKDQIRRAAVSVMSNIAEGYAGRQIKNLFNSSILLEDLLLKLKASYMLHWIWDISLEKSLIKLTKPSQRSLGL